MRELVTRQCAPPYTPCGWQHAGGPPSFPLECFGEQSLTELLSYSSRELSPKLSRTPGTLADGTVAYRACADFLDRGATSDRASGNLDFAGRGSGYAALAGGFFS